MNSPSRILVVDDEPTSRLALARSLERAGYEVLTANDGFQAVESVSRQHPDLVVLDVMMPGRNGLEACRILKGQAETAAIPVIFVTGVSEADQILEAFSVGGCDYITKPFRSDEVLARVSVHVRLRRAEEELRQKNREMEKLAAELAVLSRVDPLTNLLNRRTWQEVLDREHERFRRSDRPYAIVMLDVDHFKAFNDLRGHQAGDVCLRRIAESIAASCRKVDRVGRYGGEEFIVLAPDTLPEAAVKLAERIRKGVWGLGIPHPGNANVGRITITAGVSASTPGSWEDVLRKADDALYVAKRAGRNMVYGDAGVSPLIAPPATTGRSAVATGSSCPTGDDRTTVLVVDDEPTNQTLCGRFLQHAGYQVRQAIDGHEALASVDEYPPDVIIMDVMMPNLDGLECTRRLKANPDTRDIPIIMVSALAEDEDILAGLEAGADEYLTKPIRTTELTLRVRSMARQYQSQRDLLRSYQVRGEHVRILTRLVEFCRAIGGSRRLNEVLDCTIAAVADMTQSHRISVMLPEGDQQKRLGIRRAIGVDRELAATVKVPVGEPVAGQVFASGKPVVLNHEGESRVASKAYDSHFFASVPLVSTPLGASGSVLGVLNVTDRAGRRPFEAHELEHIELIAKIAATAIHDILTRESYDQACDSIMVALAKLAEHRDSDTGMHLDRVTRYCLILAEELRQTDRFRDRIDDTFRYNLVRAVPLHDIGKVAIPDQILLYPGKLTDEQMTVMREHSAIGAKTIRSLIERAPGAGFLEMAADIAHYHHEWYDGCGYPLGLKEQAIPLAARITALADVYDALTTKRLYKEAFSHDKAVAIILEASGTQFDPAIVAAFLERETEFAALAVSLADETPHEAVTVEAVSPGAGPGGFGVGLLPGLDRPAGGSA